MIIITVGKSYIDIDGYASGIAYQELLRLQGINAKFVSMAKPNYSITKSLIKNDCLTNQYEGNSDDQFIILDLSNKAYFPEFVKEDKIVEIIDHHPGFENYWQNILGNKAMIKDIGAVATIIVSKFEEANLLNQINPGTAKLLMAAILDNTLNFTANITTTQDTMAYQKLLRIVNDESFKEQYFLEVQSSIMADLNNAIVNDIKVEPINSYLPDTFGQLTIWDASLLLTNKDEIIKIMNTYSNDWIINLIALKDNASYLLTSNNKVKQELAILFNTYFEGDTLLIKPAYLRKEIMKRALEYEKNKF